MSARTVRRIHRAVRDDLGDLVTRRPLPNPLLEQIDPFLFLNHHGPQIYPPNNAGLPFGPHPHRGFETVTFILEGSLAHRDTGGHESVIHSGGVQWMTAGRGLEHAELSPVEFLEEGGPLEILQLWVNLPARLKWVEPRYFGLQEESIPVIPIAEGAANVHLVSGEWAGEGGPIESITGVRLMTLSFLRQATITIPVEPERSIFFYVVRGKVMIGGEIVEGFHLVEMEDDGSSVQFEGAERTLVVFGDAEPIDEPVVAHGPFVMNSVEEIFQAVRDYEAGKFR